MIAGLRADVARALETGRPSGVAAWAWGRLAARKWSPRAPVGEHVRTWSVVGSRLGGSLATPLVLALGREAASGVRVALVTRVNVGDQRGARVVSARDDVRDVGDEALWLARAAPDVVVVACRSLAEGVAVASRHAAVVVVDGRVAAHVRVLAHDPRGPLACPPAGDLRAPLDVLRAWATDELLVDDALLSVELPDVTGRVLLATAIARPQRVVVATHPLAPVHHVAYPDHGGPGFARAVARALERYRAEVVVCTEKCATWLPTKIFGRDVRPIVARVRLPDALRTALTG